MRLASQIEAVAARASRPGSMSSSGSNRLRNEPPFFAGAGSRGGAWPCAIAVRGRRQGLVTFIVGSLLARRARDFGHSVGNFVPFELARSFERCIDRRQIAQTHRRDAVIELYDDEPSLRPCVERALLKPQSRRGESQCL
jgi:hypothetical protein